MTFNTCSYGNAEEDNRGRNVVMEYILSERPDIVAVQEGFFWGDKVIKATVDRAEKCGYQFCMAVIGQSHLGLYSRLPIVKHDIICHSSANGAAAYYLLDKKRDTIIVVNAHLQSLGFTQTERETFREFVARPESFDSLQGKRGFLKKIGEAGKVRALQADSIAMYIERHKDTPLILLGDFNDTPISYARQRASEGLTDVFRSSGNGIGRSFSKDYMYVRIDHAFCSAHFKPYAARIDKGFGLSDHYPLITYLKPLPPAAPQPRRKE